jgi:hypothetical protein
MKKKYLETLTKAQLVNLSVRMKRELDQARHVGGLLWVHRCGLGAGESVEAELHVQHDKWRHMRGTV